MVPDESSLYDLIQMKNWKHVRMHIRIDDIDIAAKDYNRTKLHDGDKINIIPQFGGG